MSNLIQNKRKKLRKNLKPVWKKIEQILFGQEIDPWEYSIEAIVSGTLQVEKLVSKGFGMPLTQNIQQLKRSETLVILGSGPSIARVKEEDWKTIAKCDSIGFNYWMSHPFIPSFYMFQGGDEKMLNAFYRAEQKLKHIPILVRGSDFTWGKIDFNDERIKWIKNNQVFFLKEYPINGFFNFPIDNLFNFMEIQGYLEFGKIGAFVPKWRSSIGLLLSWAYQMGYKEVVLGGVDMMSNTHFWDEPELSHLKEQYDLPISAPINKLKDKKEGYPTLPEYVYAFNEWGKNKQNFKISLLSRETILFPSLPLWEELSNQ